MLYLSEIQDKTVTKGFLFIFHLKGKPKRQKCKNSNNQVNMWFHS